MDLVKIIQRAIKFVIVVIFVGYIMIWIMMPTNTFWLHWLPHLNATYFGEEGTNIVIHSLPVLLIAALGCLCLHLDKYSDGTNNRPPSLASWTQQPVLLRGPLGILSWTELCCLLMFVALLLWSFSSYVHAMFNNITRQSSSKIGQRVWEARLDSVALLLGFVGNICLSFLFFPVTRASPILHLLGLTSESSIKYHIWLGHALLTIFLSHGLCYIVYWANTRQISEMLKWNKGGASNVAGEVALLSGLAIWITSSSPIRRKLFELFFYTHHLYVVFVVFFLLHVGFSYSCIMLPGFYIFLIDRFLRLLQSQQNVRLISARVLPCNAMELSFSKDPRLTYNPSSTIFINVKSISKLQWHPFTVTSNSNTDRNQLSIVIKSEGDWSQKLYQMLSSPTPPDRLQVSVEGPYSPPSPVSSLRHDMLMLVSGGSGITPFISIIRELIFISNTDAKAVPRVMLVAAFKKSTDLAMLDLLLPLSHEVSHLKLQIQAYITREDADAPTETPAKTIWFKPSVSDSPIAAVLGASGWLWLAAIITSSFTIFLLLIALLNRYYSRPIDNIHLHTTIISALILCSSVAITATLAFVWNKTQHARQIRNATTPTAVESPEIESAPPRQQLLKEVYYGQRPDLKKILSECGGSNVGVLVSGPEMMRRDVALFCSPKGLHYRSFSFKW